MMSRLQRVFGQRPPAVLSATLLADERIADPERRAVLQDVRSLTDWPNMMLRDGRVVVLAPWEIALVDVPLDDLAATVRDLRRLSACVFETLARQGGRDLLRRHFEDALDTIEQRVGVAGVVGAAFDEGAAGDPKGEADSVLRAGAGQADDREGEGEVFDRPRGDGLAGREPASGLHHPDPISHAALKAVISALLDTVAEGRRP